MAQKDQRILTQQAFGPLADELGRLQAEFPNLVPPINSARLYRNTESGGYYEVVAVRAHLATVLGRLSIEVESTEATPVTERREFNFVQDAGLRAILERDYEEVQKAYVAGCWKAVIILSGGALEAVLLDLVLANESRAKASAKAPHESNVRRWELSELIAVCVDLKLIGPYASTVSDATRAYRNLVHPGYELRNRLKFSREEASIALNVLNMVHRDLSA